MKIEYCVLIIEYFELAAAGNIQYPILKCPIRYQAFINLLSENAFLRYKLDIMSI
jgi:hypothetical protein